MFTKRKSLLLGILAAATATGLALGVNGVVDAYVGEPLEVNAEDSVMTDRITADKLKASGTSYASFEYTSPFAKYVGKSAKTNAGSIQLRSSGSDCGIVISENQNYLVSSIDIAYDSSTANGRTVDVYGSFTAFGSAAQLYNTSGQTIQTELIGSIVYDGSTDAQHLEFATQYPYIGLRSKSSALYLQYVDINYVSAAPATPITGLEFSGSYKTEYYDQEVLDLSNLVVTGIDGNGESHSNIKYTTEPLSGTKLNTGDEVYVIYDDSLRVKIDDITVSPRTIESLEITKSPNKTSYVVGQSFDPTGLEALARFDKGDDLKLDASELTFSPEAFDASGSQEVTATYTYDGKQVSATLTVSVSELKVSSLNISGQQQLFDEDEPFGFGDGCVLTAKWNNGSTEDKETILASGDLNIEIVDSISSAPGTGTKIDIGTPMGLSNSGKYVLISYNGGSTKYQINVRHTISYSEGSFVKVTDVNDLLAGDWIILVAEKDGNFMTMGDQKDTYRLSVSLNKDDNFMDDGSIVLTSGGDIQAVELLDYQGDGGKYTLGVGDQYLYSNAEKSLKTGSTISSTDYSWDISIDQSGFATISNGTNKDWVIQYNSSSPRFTCYTSNQVKPLIYRFVEFNNSTGEFASEFLAASLCDGGINAPSQDIWNTLSTKFETLSDTDKEAFKAAVANVSGTEIEQCVARYDYIVGKYGLETYNDFMGRNPARIASALSIRNSDDVMDIAVISALAIAGIAAAGAFVFLRRKKEA